MKLEEKRVCRVNHRCVNALEDEDVLALRRLFDGVEVVEHHHVAHYGFVCCVNE